MKTKKITKKKKFDDLVFGDGSKISEKEKQELREAVEKHRAQRRKKAA